LTLANHPQSYVLPRRTLSALRKSRKKPPVRASVHSTITVPLNPAALAVADLPRFYITARGREAALPGLRAGEAHEFTTERWLCTSIGAVSEDYRSPPVPLATRPAGHPFGRRCCVICGWISGPIVRRCRETSSLTCRRIRSCLKTKVFVGFVLQNCIFRPFSPRYTKTSLCPNATLSSYYFRFLFAMETCASWSSHPPSSFIARRVENFPAFDLHA